MTKSIVITPLRTPLPDQWDLLPLGPMCTKIGSGATPKGGSAAYIESGISFIRSQNVLDHAFSKNGLVYIDNETAERLTYVTVEPRDVLLNITGDGDTIARCCVVPPNILPARTNQHVVIVRTTPNLVPEYLQKYLSHPLIRDYMLSHNSGGSRRAITKGQIEGFQIVVPPLSEQHAIASILGALDDKIAINDQIMIAADELIRTHYARLSLSADEAIRLDQIGSISRDITPVETLTDHENYIGLEHMPKRNMWLDNWEPPVGLMSAKSRFKRGDILFGKLRPYFHKVGLAFVDGISSTDILVVRPKQDIFRGWLLAALSSDEVVGRASAVGDGTRMPRVRWNDLASYEVPWIGRDDAANFTELVSPIVSRVSSAIAESRILADLRDALLPELMSGAIRIKDAEKSVEETT